MSNTFLLKLEWRRPRTFYFGWGRIRHCFAQYHNVLSWEWGWHRCQPTRDVSISETEQEISHLYFRD